MTKGRKPHPQDLINLAKGRHYTPWRGQRCCDTQRAREIERAYNERPCKPWGKE